MALAPSSIGGATKRMPKHTVLVVEDDPHMARVVTTLLTSAGYRVLSAGDGRAAIEILSGKDSIDLVFTDLVMPRDVNGLDVAGTAARQRPGMKVLLTSGFGHAPLVAQGLNDDFLIFAKPYRARDLTDTIRAMLAD
jgi:DNA-binding NtrC family response regulator